MTDRTTRLMCLGLILAGVAGTVAMLLLPDLAQGANADATAAFPLSVGGGILGLHLVRPNRHKTGERNGLAPQDPR